jgi:hypothetical protein
MFGIVDPNIEQYKVFAGRYKGGFRDYHLQAIFRGEDEKDYFLTFTLARMMNRDLAKLEIISEPLWFLTTPSAKVVQEGEKPEINIGGNEPMGAMKTEVSESSFTATMGSYKAICTPPTYQFIHDGKDVSIDLHLSNLGTPFWFGQGKEEGALVTPSQLTYGMEMFGKLDGSITLGGKKIAVQGVGIHEHIIAENASWLEKGWQDWIWFFFDEMYGLLYDVKGGNFKDGGIYLMKEKEYLVVRDIKIDWPTWAYSPTLQHHLPMSIIAKAQTDKGALVLTGNAIKYLPWRKVNKYRPSMTNPGVDMEFQWSGKFSYKDGRSIDLKDGKGGDEIIAVYNFMQRLP